MQGEMEKTGIISGGGYHNRIRWLDIARSFAILSISLNHAVNRSYPITSEQHIGFLSIGNASAIFAAVMQIISRIGVPVFLMISGALLLKKDFSTSENVKNFYKRNLLPLFITTEIWLFVMYWYISFPLVLKISGIKDVIRLVFKMVTTMCFANQNTMGSMWYMPMILCVYTVIPAVALSVKKYSAKLIMLPCSIVFVSAFLIPNINSLLEQLNFSKSIDFELEAANVFSMYLLYVIAGYYISCGALKKIKGKALIVLTALCFIGCCAYQFLSFKLSANYVVRYYSTGILLTSIGLFEIFRRYTNREFIFTKFYEYISKISFAIYFVHICIMYKMNEIIEPYKMCISRPIQLISLELVSLLGSIIIIYILSKIKFFKKYVFLIKS